MGLNLKVQFKRPEEQEIKPVTPIFSSPELAQGELLGYRDVRRTCGRP